ncbi:MAG: OmpA family protein [Treponema sp.]|nr:OmpA family protein [Treponema sp.]
MKRFFLFFICLSTLLIPCNAQESQINFDVSFSANWAGGQLVGQTGFNLAQAGLRLPTGRFLGEETLRQAYPQILQPYLLALRVDSSTTVRDLVGRGDISLDQLYNISLEAGRNPASLSGDLSRMTGRFSIDLESISSLLLTHRQVNNPIRPILPVPTQNYTGIIIIADDLLPVRGRRTSSYLEPCLFPKIWDTEMNLIYDLSMFDRSQSNSIVRYAATQSIFRPTPTGLDPELLALVGANPMRIIAREAFGFVPTDPVIDPYDALRILSSEHNRRLLAEGRVVLVLDESRVLLSEISPDDQWQTMPTWGFALGNEPENRGGLPAAVALSTVPGIDIDIIPIPEGILLSIRDIRFAPDLAEFLPDEVYRLDIIAEALHMIPYQTFLVEGHTASTGRPTGEMELSIERARRMVEELVERGISEDRFVYRGWGGTMPIDDNATEAGRNNNRRVEITILD